MVLKYLYFIFIILLFLPGYTDADNLSGKNIMCRHDEVLSIDRQPKVHLYGFSFLDNKQVKVDVRRITESKIDGELVIHNYFQQNKYNYTTDIDNVFIKDTKKKQNVYTVDREKLIIFSNNLFSPNQIFPLSKCTIFKGINVINKGVKERNLSKYLKYLAEYETKRMNEIIKKKVQEKLKKNKI